MQSFGDINKKLYGIKLSSIVSKFIPLVKKSEHLHFAKCPFHVEKTASFAVNDVKNLYYCFGCKKSGNAIIFIMNYKRIKYHEALDFLVNLTDLTVIKNNVCKTKVIASKNDIYYDILNSISNLYHISLIKSKDSRVLNFLRTRNINNDVIKFFELGFATSSFAVNTMLKDFSSNIITQLLDLKCIRVYNTVIYDKFNWRFIFPIKNVQGNIVGFAGRALGGDLKNKYINSAASIIFAKKNTVYGLYEALSIGNNSAGVIVVEGYLDVISLYSYGIRNVVSTMGTAFSMEQFILLKKYYNKIVICYDGDKAGRDASFLVAKNLLKFLGEDIYIGFIILPEGYDPDSIVNSEKKNFFIDILKKPVYILDFIMYHLSKSNQNKVHNELIFTYMACKKLVNEIPDISLRKIVSNYFDAKILLYRKPFVSMTKHPDSLSLCVKAIIFLVKNRMLINYLDSDITSVIKCSNKIDSELLFELVCILKNNMNACIPSYFLNKIEVHIDMMYLIDQMPLDVLIKEFSSLIKKITN